MGCYAMLLLLFVGLSSADAFSVSPTGRRLATPNCRFASPLLAIPDDELDPLAENKYSTDW